MDKQRGKILVLGPKRCGKTRIANFLSGFEENPNFEVYKPTAGTRILEFERVAKAGKTSINMQVLSQETHSSALHRTFALDALHPPSSLSKFSCI